MKRERLTMAQALVKFLDNQYIEVDGVESKFVSGIFGIFGHGCVVGVGQALEQGGHNLKFYQTNVRFENNFQNTTFQTLFLVKYHLYLLPLSFYKELLHVHLEKTYHFLKQYKYPLF